MMASKFAWTNFAWTNRAANSSTNLGSIILFIGVIALFPALVVFDDPTKIFRILSSETTIKILVLAVPIFVLVLGCGFRWIGDVLMGIFEIGKKLETLESRILKPENLSPVEIISSIPGTIKSGSDGTLPVIAELPKCHSCGALLEGGEKFCEGCGKPV